MPGKSFSIDTIRYFVQKERGHTFYLILGLDAFRVEKDFLGVTQVRSRNRNLGGGTALAASRHYVPYGGRGRLNGYGEKEPDY